VEELRPGDYVIGHDRQPHRVIRTIKKTHQGKMIGIRHSLCQTMLWVTGDHRVLCQKRTISYGGDRSWEHIPKNYFGLARELRKNLTPAESKLWKAIKGNQLGVKFRRQHPIGRYITDFYAREKGCVIEVDGESHYTAEAIAYDQARDAYLQSLGLTILRFNNQEIYHQLEGVLETIQATLDAVKPSEDNYREWRRADSLQVGDMIYFGINQIPCEIIQLDSDVTRETVYDLEVEGVHSFITEVCTVHNCGSGTTAYVAEQWGRRWITIDTSRVALALARTRLMSAQFDYYLLADSEEGITKEAEIRAEVPPVNPTVNHDIRKGFVYKRVPHITLKAIANNEEIDVIYDKWQEKLEPIRAELNKLLGKKWEEWEIPREPDKTFNDQAKKLLEKWWDYRIKREQEIDDSIAKNADYETLYDQPYIDNKRIRVTGRFTVESLSPHRVISTDIESPKSDVLSWLIRSRGDRFFMGSGNFTTESQSYTEERGMCAIVSRVIIDRWKNTPSLAGKKSSTSPYDFIPLQYPDSSPRTF
jgi:very-short-patch-repair endonuclease